jgi:hypothetical protein
VRPIGPLIAGAVQQIALGAPLVLAGAIKGGYDLGLWRGAGHLPSGCPTDGVGWFVTGSSPATPSGLDT